MRFLRETLALAGLAFQIGLVWLSWNSMPARVPTHFGFSGRADAYGGKSSLLVLPAASIGLYALVTVASFFPRAFNYPVAVTDGNRERLEAIALALMGWLKAEITWIFAYICWAGLRVAQGQSSGLGWAFLPLVLGGIGATLVIAVVQMQRAG